jgi:hypothetical protein
LICCFHSFFLKPLSVTLPFAARFTDGGDSEPCAKCIQNPAIAETVTVVKGQRETLARFLISLPNLGSVSDP